MYSAVTKKASLSAFQRWELGVLSDQPESQELHAPTAQQLEALRVSAQEEGFKAGYAEGMAQGRSASESENRLAAEQLQNIVNAFSLAVKKLPETVGPSLADLAAQIAQRIVNHELTVRPETINDLVQELMSEAQGHPVRLFLHPEDAGLVRSSSAENALGANAVIVESTQIERGGCRLETPLMSIDNTLDITWKRVMNAFHSKVPWIGKISA